MSTRKNLISRSRFYIFGFATALIILIWWASLYSSVVQIATALLVLLGIFSSLILPGLLITWLGLIYLVVGVLMLMIGSFVMGIPEKIGADVKIMDRFFRHLELPDSENFSKPGFQLKAA
ncbi:MAG: hypothetical protein UFS73_01170 [Weissella confusa]|nr:hypothetical protein [Weissella confusa]